MLGVKHNLQIAQILSEIQKRISDFALLKNTTASGKEEYNIIKKGAQVHPLDCLDLQFSPTPTYWALQTPVWAASTLE